jgi:hypothetical protein
MVNGQPVCGTRTYQMNDFFVDSFYTCTAGCTYNGVGYNATSQFPAGDGCNNCYCRNRVAHCSNNSCATGIYY